MVSTRRFPKSYERMSPQALRAYLNKRKLPPPIVEKTLAVVLDERKAARPALKKSEHHARLWHQLIEPARAELRNVRRMQALKLRYPSPERDEALAAYAALLEFLFTRLSVDRDATTEMPRVIALERSLPNNGEHWVDWVPRKKVALIEDYFASIPNQRGVRRKNPFPVTLPKEANAQRRAVLTERTIKEIEHIERLIAAELADPRLKDTSVFKQQEINALRVRLSQMQSALHTIEQLADTAFVPRTWHRLFETRTLPGEPAKKGLTP